MNDCATCFGLDCGETELIDWFSLQGPSFRYALNCPHPFTCTNQNIFLVCCDRILSVTIPPTATIAQRDEILAFYLRECARLEADCGGGIPPPRPPTGTPTDVDNPVPPVMQFYYNSPQTCTVNCSSGGTFTYTVRAGIFAATTQQAADLQALKYACSQANLKKICLLPLANDETCTGVAASFTFRASGQLATFPNSNFWTVFGTIPPGMTFNGGVTNNKFATLTGTPTTAGTFTFEVQVVVPFPDGASQIREYTITTFGVSTSSLPDATQDSAYSEVVATSGLTAPLTFRVSNGSLPAGLSLNTSTGLITGTPTASGSSTFTIEVEDAIGKTCSKEFTLLVESGITLHSYWKYEEAAGTRADSQGSNNLSVQLGVPSNDVGIVGNCLKFSTAASMRIGNAAVDIIDLTTNGATLVGAYNRSAASPLTIWQNVISDVLNVSLIGFSVTTSGGNIIFNMLNFVTFESKSITLSAASLSTWGFYRAWIDTNKFMHLQLDNGAISDLDATALFPLASTPHHGNLIVSKGTANYTALIDETAFFDGVLSDADYAYIYNSGAWRTLGPGYPGT